MTVLCRRWWKYAAMVSALGTGVLLPAGWPAGRAVEPEPVVPPLDLVGAALPVPSLVPVPPVPPIEPVPPVPFRTPTRLPGKPSPKPSRPVPLPDRTPSRTPGVLQDIGEEMMPVPSPGHLTFPIPAGAVLPPVPEPAPLPTPPEADGGQPCECGPEDLLSVLGEAEGTSDAEPYEVFYDFQGVEGVPGAVRPRRPGRGGAALKRPRAETGAETAAQEVPAAEGAGGVAADTGLATTAPVPPPTLAPAPAPAPAPAWVWPAPSWAWPVPTVQPPTAWPTPEIRMPTAVPSPAAAQPQGGAPLPLEVSGRSREIEIAGEAEPLVEVRGLPATGVAIGGLLCLLWLQAKVQQKRAIRAMQEERLC
ncbi:hypothetical protein HS048_33850 [Planomonospora sp. ID91781]|uniref:hypothetical protein n=1 Tax=Planomonospora sp. ID91781 TaxID=2738135 RepID=UPI0018C3697B|nr:hypothetical protein [Planomonospora sp. ID91781]MBG0825671.1 hypothetical protein [Planomonospora sp. ID91781]